MLGSSLEVEVKKCLYVWEWKVLLAWEAESELGKILLWFKWNNLFYLVSHSRIHHQLHWFYSLVIWTIYCMFVGGSRCGFPAFWTQFSGSGCDHALRYSSRAITTVCITHHLLPEHHPSPGTQIHSSGRVHSGNA